MGSCRASIVLSSATQSLVQIHYWQIVKWEIYREICYACDTWFLDVCCLATCKGDMKVKRHCAVPETLTQWDRSLITYYNILKHLAGKSTRVFYWQHLQRELEEVKRKKQAWKDDTSNVALVYIQNCQTSKVDTLSSAVKDLTFY